MDFADLQAVCAAADCGNFNGAARLLGLNASTISRRIAHLEDQLGITLFERTATGVRLTPGGADVVSHARRITGELASLQAASLMRANAAAGEIKLGLRIPTVGAKIQALLRRWRLAHPEIALTIRDLSDSDLAGAVIGRKLDAIIAPSLNLWAGAVSIPLFAERFVLAMAADHPLRLADRVTWAALAGQTILIQSADDNHAKRTFFAELLSTGVRFQPHTASTPTILGLVGCGFGLAFVQSGMADASYPGVVFREIDEPDVAFHVHLVWHPEAEDPAIGRFVAFMRDQAKLGVPA
jgi:DNA-binding transcriptional LysR family regulator